MMFPVDHLAQQKSFFNGEMTHSVPWNSITESLLMVKYVNFFIHWVWSAHDWLARFRQAAAILGCSTSLGTVKVQSEGCCGTAASWPEVFTHQLLWSITWLWFRLEFVLSPLVCRAIFILSGELDCDIFLAGLFASWNMVHMIIWSYFNIAIVKDTILNREFLFCSKWRVLVENLNFIAISTCLIFFHCNSFKFGYLWLW